ncbi:MAG: J domain-containing protein [Alphaproteobacteria bacterium]|nr:J domain-containing protein [Alphaproteobacteria bacterium]
MAGRSLRFGLAALAVLVALAPPGLARAGEAIVMPFSCGVKSGKPTLNSAAPTRHEIIGERAPREYRACKGKAERDCRSMAIYSFSVRCQHISAPWHELAAQIRSNEVGLSWIDEGQLNLVLKNKNAGATDRRMARFVMPKGYAPIDELGAKIVTIPAADVSSSDAPAGHFGAEFSTGRQPIVPRIDNAVIVTPAFAGAEGGDGAAGADAWTTVVHHGDEVSNVAGGGAHPFTFGLAQGPSLLTVIFLLAGTSLVAALGWFGRRYAVAVRGRELAPAMPQPDLDTTSVVPGRTFVHLTGAAVGLGAMLHSRWVGFKWRRLKAGKPWEWSNDSIANGARSADALYEKAETAVKALGPASSLKDTLTTELKSVRQRLDGLRGGSGERPKTARVSASLRAVVRDLERIGRIAESAGVGVKAGGDQIVMPRTKTEAFEVLGVNANVTDGALKRIVDALRMGWHPDHARDETDKRQREERTKQINIAWDLIVGKRVA